jgi:hypothetical protein
MNNKPCSHKQKNTVKPQVSEVRIGQTWPNKQLLGSAKQGLFSVTVDPAFLWSTGTLSRFIMSIE